MGGSLTVAVAGWQWMGGSRRKNEGNWMSIEGDTHGWRLRVAEWQCGVAVAGWQWMGGSGSLTVAEW
jgi:hypothetical protein